MRKSYHIVCIKCSLLDIIRYISLLSILLIQKNVALSAEFAWIIYIFFKYNTRRENLDLILLTWDLRFMIFTKRWNLKLKAWMTNFCFNFNLSAHQHRIYGLGIAHLAVQYDPSCSLVGRLGGNFHFLDCSYRRTCYLPYYLCFVSFRSATKSSRLNLARLDLSDMSSVRHFANQILASQTKLHVLICNGSVSLSR